MAPAGTGGTSEKTQMETESTSVLLPSFAPEKCSENCTWRQQLQKKQHRMVHVVVQLFCTFILKPASGSLVDFCRVKPSACPSAAFWECSRCFFWMTTRRKKHKRPVTPRHTPNDLITPTNWKQSMSTLKKCLRLTCFSFLLLGRHSHFLETF